MNPIKTDSSLFRYSFTFFSDKKKHLKHLFSDQNRFKKFSRKGSGIFFDFSRQLIDEKSFSLLTDLAYENRLIEKFNNMASGGVVNKSEQRKALHTLCRGFGYDEQLSKEIASVNDKIKEFSNKIHSGEIKSATGKKFTDICIVGIGGSSLGTEFVLNSMENTQKLMDYSFISSCDPNEFISYLKDKAPETTLFIIISKSYTTREVLVNEHLITSLLEKRNIPKEKHIVRITAKGSAGDSGNSDIKSFHMFDSIGGRYSVSSAVGGLPISLVYGYETFKRFLAGAREMDQHAATESPEKNIPVISALLDIWNSVYLNFPNLAIIPYSALLHKLPDHIQQLYMESNGKRVNENNEIILDPTSMVIFGCTGTKCQHSFFQLFHQGRIVPVEFIGVLKPPTDKLPLYDKISSHNELWANILAQADALAFGTSYATSPEKECPGNRPSSIITIKQISPENIGRLISFYEARTVFAGFLLGINPFDQYGVELGKKLADQKRDFLRKTFINKKLEKSDSNSFNFYQQALLDIDF